MEEGAQFNASIEATMRSNEQLRKDTAKLQKQNIHLRQTLEIIQDKVNAAKDFLSESMRDTDDTGADELRVLEPTTPKPTLDQFLKVAVSSPKEDVQSEFGSSLLQISSHFRRREGDPSDLVEVLAHSLEDIAEAQKEGEAHLKESFVANLEAGQKRYQELTESNMKMNSTLNVLKQEGTELLAAKKHLEATHKDLQQRLVGLRKFAAKIDAFSVTALGIPEKVTAKLVKNSSQSVPGAVKTGHASKPKLLLAQTVAMTQKAQKAHASQVSSKASKAPAKHGSHAATAQPKTVDPAVLSRTLKESQAQAQQTKVKTALAHAAEAVAQAGEAEGQALQATQKARPGKQVPFKSAMTAAAGSSTAMTAKALTKAEALSKKKRAASAGKAGVKPSLARHAKGSKSPTGAKAADSQASGKSDDSKTSWRSWLSSWR